MYSERVGKVASLILNKARLTYGVGTADGEKDDTDEQVPDNGEY